ncbi:MAG: ATP cone domain-containing protein [Candidatus Nanohaloarchaea archaeon]
MGKIVKSQGEKEEFDEGKLWHSIYYPAREAHYTEEEAVELADDAKQEVMGWMDEHEDDVLTSKELRQKISEILSRKDEDVEFLYRKHLDLN